MRPPLLSPGGSHRDHKKSQTFLTLQEPVDRSELRRIRTAEVGWYYQIPFRFEVPPDLRKPDEWQAQLGESVRQAQLKLPPSYEKDSVPSTAPNIVSISYCIKAKLLRYDMEEPLGKTSRTLRIMPIVKDEPPLYIFSTIGKENVATTTAYLEGKAWTGSQGRMEMEVAQPKSLCVPISTGYDTCQKESVETRAEMKLRFEPIEVNGIPPKLTRITAKLRAATRVSSNLMMDCPYRIGIRTDGTDDGLSVETMPLAGGTVQEVKWHRDSVGGEGDTKSSEQAGGRIFLTTVLPLRLVLPLKKHYLPTFHSPLISHFYVVVLVLSFRKHGDAVALKKEKLRLEVPIQVSSELFLNQVRSDEFFPFRSRLHLDLVSGTCCASELFLPAFELASCLISLHMGNADSEIFSPRIFPTTPVVKGFEAYGSR